MADWVYTGHARWTEMRIHGVSGTPPEGSLEHPDVTRVCGDAASGFYRRVWPAESVSPDDEERVVEAYSWGGLTSGGRTRALWLLLVPFLLVNMAFYTSPARKPGERQRLREAVQRLFALTITATLVLATVNVTMDFAGWQCGRPVNGRVCTSSWVTWLSWPWLDQPGRRIAVMALVPTAVVVLLWWLANRTWTLNEDTKADWAPPTEDPATMPPLENRKMWNGSKPVRLLRAVHVTGGLTLVGVLALAPFETWPPHAEVGAVLFAALLVLGAACLLLALWPGMSERPPVNRDQGKIATPVISALPWVAGALLLGALLWLFIVKPEPRPGPSERTTLPWLSAALHGAIGAQVVLLLVMVAILVVRRSWRTGAAWRGFATPGLMLFGSVMSGSYAAAMVLSVAHVLGKPMATVKGRDPLVTSMPYFWGAAIAPALLGLAVILTAFATIVTWSTARDRQLKTVEQRYSTDGTDPRAVKIAWQWARAGLNEVGRRMLGLFAVLTGILMLAVVGAYLWHRMAAADSWLASFANVGDWIVGLFALGMLYIGRLSFSSVPARRIVGILWDVGTFWPRAVHPLAPPCYTERAAPQLTRRIDSLIAKDRYVLLAGHSQGSVIAAAVVDQLTYEQSAKVALLTYGSPLERLYVPFFPTYFGAGQLARTGSFMLGSPDEPADRWPWRNLYRPSDPIGGPIFPNERQDHVVDRYLLDPDFAEPPGDIVYPPTLGHSSYPLAPAWSHTIGDVENLREPASEADRPKSEAESGRR
jgi:hypothetical protein